MHAGVGVWIVGADAAAERGRNGDVDPITLDICGADGDDDAGRIYARRPNSRFPELRRRRRPGPRTGRHPSSWTAVATVRPDSYEIRYSGSAGQVVTLSVSIPNPAPPEAASTQRTLAFRGDSQAVYQDQDHTNPASLQWIIWNEPGRWAGDPSVQNSARADSVPYFLMTSGVTPDQFWQYANSLAPVPVSGRPPTQPTLTVTPNRDLVDGQSVHVALSGLQPWERVRISECSAGDSASNEGCGAQLAAQPFVDTDANGAGDIAFTVHSTAAVKPYNTIQTRPCTDQCVIVAARGVDGQPPGQAAIRFR